MCFKGYHTSFWEDLVCSFNGGHWFQKGYVSIARTVAQTHGIVSYVIPLILCLIFIIFILEGVWWEADDGIKYAQNMKDCKHINFQGVYAFCGNAYEGNHADVERLRDETIGE